MANLTYVYDYADVPTLKAFSESDKFVRALMGPFGSGKSSGCVMEIFQRAIAQAPDALGVRKTRWAVIRNSYPQLRDTTIKTVHDWFPPKVYGSYNKTDHTYIIDRVPMTDKTKVHCEIRYLALDQPEHVGNLLSMELTGAWLNECREIPKLIFDTVQGRLNRFPPVRDGGASWSGLIADTNPCDTDHWFYKLFEEKVPFDGKLQKDFQLWKQPSGLAPNAENMKNLPPGYYTKLAAGKDTEFVKVYVHGEYGRVRDGKPVYPNYVEALHYSKEKDIEPIRGLPLLIGADFGLDPSFLICQYLPNGKFNVIHEIATFDTSIREAVKQQLKPVLMSRFNGFPIAICGDPSGAFRKDTDARTAFMELRDNGLRAFPAWSNSWLARTSAVDSLLTRWVEGKPAFQVGKSCVVFNKGMSGDYKYRRLRVVGDEKFVDKPDKNEVSHICEAGQYAAMYAERGITVHNPHANVVSTQKEISAGAWT